MLFIFSVEIDWLAIENLIGGKNHGVLRPIQCRGRSGILLCHSRWFQCHGGGLYPRAACRRGYDKSEWHIECNSRREWGTKLTPGKREHQYYRWHQFHDGPELVRRIL